MIRFFRTRAPLFGLLLIAALLVTLPGVRHPLPMLALVVFTFLAARSLSRWRAKTEAVRSLDDQIASSAASWDERHGPPEDLETENDEPWRASLRPSDTWRGEDDDDSL